MARHRQNFVWQYHNGGIGVVGDSGSRRWWRQAASSRRKVELVKLARVCALRRWAFTDGFTGQRSRERNAGAVVERRGISDPEHMISTDGTLFTV